jgi:hypothetical protein
MVQKLVGMSIIRIRTDGAKEYVSSQDLKEFLGFEGNEHGATARYVPEINGIAERMNRIKTPHL